MSKFLQFKSTLNSLSKGNAHSRLAVDSSSFNPPRNTTRSIFILPKLQKKRY